VRSFHRTHTSTAARHALGDGEGPTDPVTLAGRLMVKRWSGGVTFAELQDGTGRIQLMARRDELADVYEAFLDLDPGDLLGVTGPVIRSRRGEVTVDVTKFQLLSKALRPLPEKWHGLKDVEQRYRQRHVDLIANPDVRDVFIARTRIISGLRRFMDSKGFLEVETPVLQEVPGGGLARPFKTHHNALDLDLYLRIALELHLKRLIVGGFEKVYEVGRVFRNEGLSPRHNPEFTMLESYEAYADYEDVMRFLEELIPATIESAGKAPELEYQGERLNFAPPYRRARMADLVKEATGIDVLTEPDLAGAAAKVGVEVQPNLPWGFVVMEIYEKKVETGLRQPTFVVDYPLDVSPLARKRADDPRFVERFELVAAGRELCNAFTELTDPVDQRERFLAQEAAFQAFGGETHPMDEDYLMALELGMPPTGGLGIGIDRLVMLLTDQASIRDVLLFPQMRPNR